MTPVVLGIDVGSKALGLALVEFEPPHRPLWADVVSINEPDAGWAHQQIGAALQGVPTEGRGYVTVQTDAGWETMHPQDREITRVVIEDPPYVKGNPRTLKVLSGVAALVQAECRRRWPWAPVIWQAVGEWKKATVGNGNASKEDVYEWVVDHPEVIGASEFRVHVSGLTQDAIDAIAIAVAGAQVELEEAA